MATEVLGWSPAPQSPPWGLDERVRPEPLPGPEFSSFHCFMWTTNPTPHQTIQHGSEKEEAAPIHPWSGFWGEGLLQAQQTWDTDPRGSCTSEWGSALSVSSGPGPFLMPAGQSACLLLYLPESIFIQLSFPHPTHLLSSYDILVRRRRRRMKPSLP